MEEPKKRGKHQQNQPSASMLNRAELLAMLAEKDSQLKEQNALLNTHQKHLSDKDQLIKKQQQYIQLMEEQLHLVTLRKFATSSEKMPWQADLFDEAELEQALVELEDDLPEEDRMIPRKKPRNRGFSSRLNREQIYLRLTEEEKAGALKTFFTKVKEELEFIPAQMKVLEYWQEKAVFERAGEESIVAAPRPLHPLGKCFATALAVGTYHYREICRWIAAIPD